MSRVRVVAAALVDGSGRVLAAQRDAPPEYAGQWEFPGGKVEDGEDERAALVRECHEELGVEVAVGEFLGEAPIAVGVLRLYAAVLVSGSPQAREHRELRWLEADELFSVPWIAADLPLVQRLVSSRA